MQWHAVHSDCARKGRQHMCLMQMTISSCGLRMLIPTRPPLTVCVGLNLEIVVELVSSQTGAVRIILPAHTCDAQGAAKQAQ